MTRRALFVAAVMILVGCGKGGTPTASVTTTTSGAACLRVSDIYHSKLMLTLRTNVAAVKSSSLSTLWYVSTPDGALWATNLDPTSGQDLSGFIIPLNAEALAASPLGRATGIGGPKAQGAAATDADAVQSVRCARAAEHP